MLGILIGVGFVAMVLAPSAVAVYSRLGSSENDKEDTIATQVPTAAAATVPTTAVANGIDVTRNDLYTRRPVPLSTSPVVAVLRSVPTLREVAVLDARHAVHAQATAAQTRMEALQEVSRVASKRAEAATKLAEAAERELLRAAQASLQAEATKHRVKASEARIAELDYLPLDHPSLDFPRSRIPSRRVA